MQTTCRNESPSHTEIAALAEKIYLESGCMPGRDVENWLLAEAELKKQSRANISTSQENTRSRQQTSSPAVLKIKQPNKQSSQRPELASTR